MRVNRTPASECVVAFAVIVSIAFEPRRTNSRQTFLSDTVGNTDMRETIDTRVFNECRATVVFDTGGPVGSDHLVIVEPVDPDRDWLVNRWFYFDEQTEPYMWNFVEKIGTDKQYRQESLKGTADWKRIAKLYESLARRLSQKLSQSERSDFPIMNDSSRPDSEKLHSLCEELFEEIKTIVRQGKNRHPETVYDEKKSELQRWLADESA